MSDDVVPTWSDLPLDQVQDIKKVCTHFEQAWKNWQEGPPRVEAFLQEMAEPAKAVLLGELVRLEIAFRLLQGETPKVAEYHQRFPNQRGFDEVLQAAGCSKDGDADEDSRKTRLPPPTRWEPPTEPHWQESAELATAPALQQTQSGFSAQVQVPGYELLRELGRGGMGVVYQAKHHALDRVVALKMILSGGHANESDLARFKTEAEAVARLQHPGIVQIHEVGEHQGLPYFSLEFCSGGSLEDKLSGTPLPAMEAAKLVEQLAQAMHYAHTKGVIHRDLKPANVLLAEDGTPKITDFGLAKKLGEEGKTATGTVMGTPSYMAPEQAEGKSSLLGPACDVYALGAILYQCLTGRPPFKAATMMDTLMQVIADEPVAPRHLSARVPLDLETICLKCLSKEPSKRYVSALSLADDLARFEKHEPIVARPVSRAERLWRWGRRNPSVAGALAAAGLILLAGTFISTYFAIQSHRSASEAKRRADAEQQAQQELKKTLQVSEQERRRAEFVSYAFRIDAARQAVRRGQPDEARAILGTCKPELCGWEHHFVLRQTNKLRLDLGTDFQTVTSGAFSPDGNRIVCSTWPRALKVWDARTAQQVLALTGHTKEIVSVAFSPDSARIVSGSEDSTLKVWDAITGEEILTLAGHKNSITSVSYSLRGKQIVSGSKDKTLKVWDTTTGKEVLTLKGHTDGVLSVAFSPDGKRIASGGEDKSIKVWDATTGEEVFTLRGHTGKVACVAYSPKGNHIVSGSEDRTVKVWDASTARETLILKEHTSGVTTVAFSPDGTRILSSGWKSGAPGEIKLWDAETGQEIPTLKGHTSGAASVAFSPDGKRVLSCSGKAVQVWDVTNGEKALTIQDHTWGGTIVTSVAISPNGKHIVSGGGIKNRSGPMKVWNAITGQEALSLKGHTNRVSSVAFSRDGKRIVSGSEDTTLKVWDANTGEAILTLMGHTNRISTVTFSPDGKRIASGSLGLDQKTKKNFGEVKVWDAQTGEETHTLSGHSNWVLGVAFSPDGERIVSASWDKTLKVWDASTGEEIHTLKGHENIVTSVAYSPDGRHIISGGHDKMLKVWHADTGEEAFTMVGHTGGVTSVVFSADGKRIVSGSEDKTLKVWDAQTGEEALTLKGHTLTVTCVLFSPDGTRIVSGSEDKTLKVWDADIRAEALTLVGHNSFVSSVAFSPDGKRIVSGGQGFDQKTRNEFGEVKVWDVNTGEALLSPMRPTTGVIGVAYSPDGTRIVSGGIGLDLKVGQRVGALKVWDASTGKEALLLKGHTVDFVTSVSFSPDGKRIVSGGTGVNLGTLKSFGEVKVWDARSGASTLTLRDATGPVAFSPDSRRIVGGSLDKTRKVWDATTGAELLILKGAFGPVSYSADGKRIVSGSEDKTLKVWDAQTGEETLTLKGHTGGVYSVAYSPDGKWIVSGSQDRTVKVWDAQTGAEALSLKGHTGFVLSVSFSPDGKRIVSGSQDRTVKVWDATTGVEVRSFQ